MKVSHLNSINMFIRQVKRNQNIVTLDDKVHVIIRRICKNIYKDIIADNLCKEIQSKYNRITDYDIDNVHNIIRYIPTDFKYIELSKENKDLIKSLNDEIEKVKDSIKDVDYDICMNLYKNLFEIEFQKIINDLNSKLHYIYINVTPIRTLIGHTPLNTDLYLPSVMQVEIKFLRRRG